MKPLKTSKKWLALETPMRDELTHTGEEIGGVTLRSALSKPSS
jgi:hypothetical protein